MDEQLAEIRERRAIAGHWDAEHKLAVIARATKAPPHRPIEAGSPPAGGQASEPGRARHRDPGSDRPRGGTE